MKTKNKQIDNETLFEFYKQHYIWDNGNNVPVIQKYSDKIYNQTYTILERIRVAKLGITVWANETDFNGDGIFLASKKFENWDNEQQEPTAPEYFLKVLDKLHKNGIKLVNVRIGFAYYTETPNGLIESNEEILNEFRLRLMKDKELLQKLEKNNNNTHEYLIQ